MVDKPEVAVAPETAPTVSEPAPEPDYKAQVAELQAKITQAEAKIAATEAEKTRAEQQAASYRGVAGQKLDYEAVEKRTTRELRQLREDLNTLLDTSSEADPAVAQKVAALRQKRAQEEQLDAAQGQVVELWGEVGETLGEAYGLDFETQSAAVWQKLQTAPELQKAYALAYQARNTNDAGLLRQALREVKNVRREAQMTAHQKELADAKAAAKKEAEEAAQEKLRESGVLTMPAAKPAGGHQDDYTQMLKKDGPLPSSEEIDRIVAARMKRQ